MPFNLTLVVALLAVVAAAEWRWRWGQGTIAVVADPLSEQMSEPPADLLMY